MYLAISFICMLIGMLFTGLTWAFPVPASRFFVPWFAALCYMAAPIIMTVRLYTSEAKYLFDPPPKGRKRLLLFIHRDLNAHFKYGERVRETSFIDCPELGIIHDLGKGCVIRIGDKFVRLVIENVSFPLPPHLVNFFVRLQRAGFTDLDEVYRFILGELNEKRMEELRNNLLKVKGELEEEVYRMKEGVEKRVEEGRKRKLKEEELEEIKKRIEEIKMKRKRREKK